MSKHPPRKGIPRGQRIPNAASLQRVYVQMRIRDRTTGKMRHVPKRSVIFHGFSTDEVYRLIVDAGAQAQERAAKEVRDGKATTESSGHDPARPRDQ